MRILLAISDTCDAVTVSDYVARRFDRNGVEVDVLTVVTRTDGSARRPRVAVAVAERLGAQHGFRRVRARVRHGVATDEIVAASERWRSTLVLIGAPRHRGMLTAFGLDSVARAVSARARCPVELVRALSLEGDAPNRVLAILDFDRLDDFPFDQLRLQSMSLRDGSLVRLIGVQCDALERFGVEANPAALLRGLARGAEERVWAEARLDSACRALAESFGPKISVDYRLRDGSLRDIALSSAEKLGASLLILDSAATDGALRGLLSRHSPAAMTMAAPCSVLLLRAGLGSSVQEEALPAPLLTPFSRS